MAHSKIVDNGFINDTKEWCFEQKCEYNYTYQNFISKYEILFLITPTYRIFDLKNEISPSLNNDFILPNTHFMIRNLLLLPFLGCLTSTTLAQSTSDITIRAREYNASAEGAPLHHFTAQVDVHPPVGAPYSLTQECDSTCHFENLPKGSALVFTATKDDQPRDSVGTYDLVLINQHYLKVALLDHPARLIAADADCNGLVEPKDIVILRRLILRIDTSFCRSWTLLNAAALLPPDPFSAPLPREIEVREYTGGPLDLSFWAIKTGNVSGFIPAARATSPPAGAFVSGPQPNPTGGGVWFGVQLPAAATLQLNVFDVQGRKLYSAHIPVQAGAQQIELPADALPASGVYIWQIIAEGMHVEGRLIRL